MNSATESNNCLVIFDRINEHGYAGKNEQPSGQYSFGVCYDFEVALDRLRLIDLQQSPNPPSYQTPSNSNAYDLSLEA